MGGAKKPLILKLKVAPLSLPCTTCGVKQLLGEKQKLEVYKQAALVHTPTWSSKVYSATDIMTL